MPNNIEIKARVNNIMILENLVRNLAKADPIILRHEDIFFNDPQELKDVLIKALGMKGFVRKIRKLYLYEQTRIHIDDVEGLGHFVEMEVMLENNQSTEDGIAIAENLMLQLHIEKQDLVDVSYIDLIDSIELPCNKPCEVQSNAR